MDSDTDAPTTSHALSLEMWEGAKSENPFRLDHLRHFERRIPVVLSRNEPGEREYPSLYDDRASTVIAVILGLIIVGGIQGMVWQIHSRAKSEYRALTQFVTMMVALVLGAYMADLLIAGPSTSLLSDTEHATILGFVKDICLMVFSYYFGTRSNGGKAEME